MRPGSRFFLYTFLGVALLFLYCEYLIFYFVQKQCVWPTLDTSKQEKNIHSKESIPVKIMVLADTHLLGSARGHWFDKLRREWQMYRAFQTAMFLHKPDLVFVLGDLTDEGFFCSNEEFKAYVKRFYSIFAVPEETQMYLAVGNHDIGFHYRITPHLNQRYEKGFNSSAVQFVTVRGNHFVLVNSMAMEGDGCFLCRSAEEELARIAKILQCTKGTYTQNCEPSMRLESYSRPILMQHYPLYRQSDMECNDFDAAPFSVKKEPFRENWECLSQEATIQLLTQIKPRLALSGHTHHGCTRKLPVGEGIEITIPSFSWRNKNNPNYGLGVFTPNNYAFVKCQMPQESTVFNLYISGGCALFCWLLVSLFMFSRKYKRKYRYM